MLDEDVFVDSLGWGKAKTELRDSFRGAAFRLLTRSAAVLKAGDTSHGEDRVRSVVFVVMEGRGERGRGLATVDKEYFTATG